jgi:hypothetical protein
MIYNLEVSINLELNSVSEKQLLEIQQILMNSLHGNKRISFDVLDKLFVISPRPYYTSSLSNIELNRESKRIEIEFCG